MTKSRMKIIFIQNRHQIYKFDTVTKKLSRGASQYFTLSLKQTISYVNRADFPFTVSVLLPGRLPSSPSAALRHFLSNSALNDRRKMS